jgi:glucose-1-phosphate thymidylyltransferase
MSGGKGKLYAIILAAGYATRLYPLTLNQPKVLLKIGKGTIIDHIVDEIDTIGDITHTVVISNDKFYDNFSMWKAERAAHKGKSNSELVILNDGTNTEETRLGAIGDIVFAINTLNIHDDIMVIAGDNFFTYDLASVYDFYMREKTDIVLVKKFADKSALKSMGVAIVAQDGQVLEFEEKPQNPGSDLGVFATYIYRKDTLPLFHQYVADGNPKDAPGNFPAWLCKRRRILAYAFDGECYDVGTPQAYKELSERYKKEDC